jgi:hypothetical protein
MALGRLTDLRGREKYGTVPSSDRRDLSLEIADAMTALADTIDRVIEEGTARLGREPANTSSARRNERWLRDEASKRRAGQRGTEAASLASYNETQARIYGVPVGGESR